MRHNTSHSGEDFLSSPPEQEPRPRYPHSDRGGPTRVATIRLEWAVLIVTVFLLFLFAAWPQQARSAEPECATCHIAALPDIIDTGAPEPAEEADNSADNSVDKSDDLEPEFDPSNLTTSTVGPDGTYYLWIPFDMTQESFNASETLRAQEEAYPLVEYIGPGVVHSEGGEE